MPYWASLVTGLSISQVVAKLGKTVRQKWINDIFFEDKKVGGILCESSNAPGGGYSLSVGVGINLTNCPEDCSMLKGINREDIFWALAKQLRENVMQADKDGPQQQF
jgi:biotin-(acetyl-CoA carboxylase) ligase